MAPKKKKIDPSDSPVANVESPPTSEKVKRKRWLDVAAAESLRIAASIASDQAEARANHACNLAVGLAKLVEIVVRPDVLHVRYVEHDGAVSVYAVPTGTDAALSATRKTMSDACIVLNKEIDAFKGLDRG